MKKTLFIGIVIITLLFILNACGDSQPRQTDSQERTARQTEETKEQTLTEVISEQAGAEVFYQGEDLYSNEDWTKLKTLTEAIIELRNLSEDRTVKRSDLQELFAQHGFESIEEGRAYVREYARLQDFMMSLTMQLSALQTDRMMQNQEGETRTIERIQKLLNDRQITKNDLTAISDNSDALGHAIAVTFIIEAAK